MKKSIRRGVFETNSSSTHSLTIMSREDYNAWGKGDLLFSRYNEEFVSRDKVLAEIKEGNPDFDFEDKDKLNEMIRNYDYQTENDYDEADDCLETFFDSYITKSGDEVVAFGKYGYEG